MVELHNIGIQITSLEVLLNSLDDHEIYTVRSNILMSYHKLVCELTVIRLIVHLIQFIIL